MQSMKQINIQFFAAVVISATTFGLIQQPSLAQRMGIPDGYFARQGSVYARSGGIICGFKKPGHLEIYRKANPPAPSINITNFTSYRYIGHCPTPASYFAHGGSVFYTAGNGKFCGFSNPDELREYQSYYIVAEVGTISTDPKQFMSYLGRCPSPQ